MIKNNLEKILQDCVSLRWRISWREIFDIYRRRFESQSEIVGFPEAWLIENKIYK